MPKKKLQLFLIIILLLTSCQRIKEGMGIEKTAPDEFAIEERASIVLPPDYALIEPDTKKAEQSKSDKDLNLIINSKLKKNDDTDQQQNLQKTKSKKTNIENQVLNKIN